MFRKIFAALTAAFMSVTTVCIAAAPPSKPSMQTGDVLLFDFGSVPEEGWQAADSSSKYNKDTGYGFSMVSFVENVPVQGSGVLSDGVKTKKNLNDKVTFNVDLPPGMYEISVYSGDISYMSVTLEGHQAILNMEYSATEARVEIPVTDGQLNVGLCRGISGTDFSVSAMTVKRTGELSGRRRRIFVCGDSTAATFYPLFVSQPLPDDCRGGWGQMLGEYTDCYVHNFASAGQSAKGFCESGALDDMLYFMQPEDYVMISFGLNDKTSCSEEEFESSMKNIIDAVKENGGIPVILSDIPTLDNFADNGNFCGTDECYAEVSERLAAAESVKYIDLHTSAAKYFESIGFEQNQSLHWKQWSGGIDKVHLNRNGAGQIARLIIENCGDLGISKLGGYGISPDCRLKCSTYKNNVYLENTTPQDMQLTLVATHYISGKLSRTETTPFILPAYDVLDPNNITELYAPLYVLSNHIYIMGNGIYIQLGWNTN
ncbi:MAG: GDSL-type esterase/lipase family protein [Candidatus Ornithomonoglobus sp.]